MKKPVETDEYGFEPFEDFEEGFESAEGDDYGFEPADADIEPEFGEQEAGEEIGEDEVEPDQEEEPGFWQSVASHPATQTILGIAKRATAPLDILKLAMLGEGLTDLDELEAAFEKAGKPFDREEYIQKVFELGESIPTQQLAEDKFKEWTGIDLAPKDTFSKIIRTGAEIASTGPSGVLKQAPKQAAKQIAKRAAGGLGGAAGGELAKQAGVPEPLADILAFTLGGAAGGKKEPFSLTGQAKKNKAVAEKHGLRKFAGMEREKPLENAIISPKTQKKVAEELETTSKAALDKIIEGKIPVTKLRSMGVNLEDAYTKAFDAANQTAKRVDASKVKIDLQPMLNNIKKKIKDIQKTAPSLSPSDKAAIGELRKQYKQLTQAPKATKPIYGPNGQVLNPPSKTRTPKPANAEQLLDQYRNFNEETRGIYRKPEFSGNEEVIKNLYGELKSDLINQIEKSSPELAKELRTANSIFSQTQKLNQAEELIGKAFENEYDPKKLNQTLGNKRNRAFLERDLGKGAVREMQDIAKYGMDAEKQVLKAVKNPKTLGELASELTPLKASLLFAKGTAGIPLVIAHDIPKALSRRAKGALMISPKSRQSYADFVRHAVSPESAAFKKASRELTKVIEDEYGSEKEFLKFIEEEDNDDEE